MNFLVKTVAGLLTGFASACIAAENLPPLNDLPLRMGNELDLGSYNFELVECLEEVASKGKKLSIVYIVKPLPSNILAVTMHFPKSKRYAIILNPILLHNDLAFIETMGHEFVHVEQFNDGRRTMINGRDHFDGIDQETLPYDKRTFEIDAFNRTEEILNKAIPCYNKKTGRGKR